MTETELHQRLSASVDDVEVPTDLVLRVRQGGSRRVRRNRFVSVGVTALTLAVVGGVALAGPGVLNSLQDTGEVASVPGMGDPYGFLMKGDPRGDLAGDRAYLAEVIAAWKASHKTSANNSRGLFDDLRGEPSVAWAGRTPAGKAAIVVQQSFLHNHADIQLDREGIHTLAGFFGPGANGKATLIADSYPAPGSGLGGGFVVGSAKTKQALVTIDLGQRMAWSLERKYTDSGSTRDFKPLKFTEGISVVELPQNVYLDGLRISEQPANVTNPYGFHILDSRFNVIQQVVSTPNKRLWKDLDFVTWAMTDGAEKLVGSANDEFSKAVEAVSDPTANGWSMSLWNGYGITADGSSVLLGEEALDEDPARTYAVLRSPDGKTTVTSGGVPDPKAVLPVQIQLPRGQGWAVAQSRAKLAYRYDGGSWSPVRDNATLVPAPEKVSAKVEVQVELNGTTDIVELD